MAREFRGTIALDVRDSVGDWEAFLPDKAPQGAPNVLVVPAYDRIRFPPFAPLASSPALPFRHWGLALAAMVGTGRGHEPRMLLSVWIKSEILTGLS